MGECFLTIISYGLRSGGGIGDVLDYVGICKYILVHCARGTRMLAKEEDE